MRRPPIPIMCLTAAAFTRSRIASTKPRNRAAQPRLIRAMVAGAGATPNSSAISSARRSSGSSWKCNRYDDHGHDPCPVLDRRRDPLRKPGSGFRAAFAAAAMMRPMRRDHQGPGLGQIEDLAGAVAGGRGRRQCRTTAPAGLGKMIDGGVGLGDLAQGLALVPLLPTRLAARLLAKAPRPGGLLQSVVSIGGLPLFRLSRPRRRSSSASRASWASSRSISWSFDRTARASPIHRILESSQPPLVNQNLGRQRPKPTKPAPLTPIQNLVAIGNLGSYKFEIYIIET